MSGKTNLPREFRVKKGKSADLVSALRNEDHNAETWKAYVAELSDDDALQLVACLAGERSSINNAADAVAEKVDWGALLKRGPHAPGYILKFAISVDQESIWQEIVVRCGTDHPWSAVSKNLLEQALECCFDENWFFAFESGRFSKDEIKLWGDNHMNEDDATDKDFWEYVQKFGVYRD